MSKLAQKIFAILESSILTDNAPDTKNKLDCYVTVQELIRGEYREITVSNKYKKEKKGISAISLSGARQTLTFTIVSKWGLSLVVGWRSTAAAYAHGDDVTAIITAVCAFVIIEGLQENGRNTQSTGLFPENSLPIERVGNRE